MIHQYDIIVFGAGIAGLWIGNRARRAGYNVVVIEKDRLGAGQTLASQGIIHGGQKYALRGTLTPQAAAIAKMPSRWQACFDGHGEIDLTSVVLLSATQVMWPAGSLVSAAAVMAAPALVNAACTRLKAAALPEALAGRRIKGPVYSLPEKVLDVRSLILALAGNLEGRILKGEVTDVSPDGEVTVSGQTLRGRLIIFAAGLGNEVALRLLRVEQRLTQRRPLRQIMIKSLPFALFGHGIVASRRPRITVTSHRIGQDEYVWYLGGSVAERAAEMEEDAALLFARQEIEEIFPDIDWSDKEWATWYGDRAEPRAKGELPAAPFVHQCGRVLLAWPTKLTFAPALSDQVLQYLQDVDVTGESPPLPLPTAELGSYPWEVAAWRNIG